MTSDRLPSLIGGSLCGLAALTALAGCSRTPAERSDGQRLEQAAIATGLVRDPGDQDVTGLYARDTDRLCIVPAGAGYRIGAAIDYGDGQRCSGAGTVSRSGGTLHVDLSAAPGCRFEAGLDGDTITFPGQLPAACDRLCADRASLSALAVDRQSSSTAEASALRDADGHRICATDI